MRRIGTAVVALTLVIAACGGDDETAATTTTAPPATTTTAAATTTAAPASTSTTAAPTTTTTTTTEAPTPPPPPGSMLITNEDGVFVATLDGVVAQVLAADAGAVGGIVDFAIGDTRGGIVVHPNQWFSTGADSIVYWAPQGSDALQQLLVPAADQSLRLEDVQPQGDTVMVYYTRRAGDTPETAAQTLRSFDLDTKTVAQLAIVGGWESGASPISVGGNTVVRNGAGEAYYWIFFSDLTDNIFDSPANPLLPDGEFDCLPDCFYYADLSPDGSQVAFGRLAPNSSGFYTIPEIELRDVASGSVLMNVALPERPAAGFIDSLDVSDTHVLINIVEEGSVFPVATVVEIASGGLIVENAPIGGVARFLRSTPDLDGVVTWP